jgi:acetyl esterase/lipase
MTSSKHLVDPQLAPILDAFAGFTVNAATLPVIRSQPRQRAAFPLSAAAEAVTCEERMVPGPVGAPEVRVLVYRQAGVTSPAAGLVDIHGGGYVMGSPDMGDVRNRTVAAEIGCTVVSVDYRLAPETPHPGPVEDCYAALKWLHANAADVGVDHARLAVLGASAGGGLAAALALLARDRSEVPLVFQLLIYPMLDDRTCAHEEPHPYTGEFVWNHASNHFGWSSLLGQEPGGPEVSQYAAAARADELKGLPPTFISTGALDLFFEEDLEYARRLTRAGVPVELHVYPGAFHAFDMLPGSDVGEEFNRHVMRALRRALASK